MAELQMLPLDGRLPLVHLLPLLLLWSRSIRVTFLGNEVRVFLNITSALMAQ